MSNLTFNTSKSLSCPRLMTAEERQNKSSRGEALYDRPEFSSTILGTESDDAVEAQQPIAAENTQRRHGHKIDLPNGEQFDLEDAITNIQSTLLKTQAAENATVVPSSARRHRRYSGSNFTVSSSSDDDDDSEDDDDGAAFVQLWPKQLKNKKRGAISGFGVVKYSPPRRSILRDQVYRHFGDRERKAIALFDFLRDYITDVSCISSNGSAGSSATKRSSADDDMLFGRSATTADGQQVPTTKLRAAKRSAAISRRRLSSSLSDLTGTKSGGSQKVRQRMTDDSREVGASQRNGRSTDSVNDDDSWDSSLLLSDLCANHSELNDDSSSSLSCHE